MFAKGDIAFSAILISAWLPFLGNSKRFYAIDIMSVHLKPHRGESSYSDSFPNLKWRWQNNCNILLL
jgi:hypothetical protein